MILETETLDPDVVRTGARAAILRGIARDWPALERWTPAYLRERAGTTAVPVRRTPLDRPELRIEDVHVGHQRLSDVLTRCEHTPDDEHYVPGVFLDDLPGLSEDIRRPEALGGVNVRGTTAFFGRNTRCLGHFHPRTHAMLVQVQGHKEIRMFPPSELRHLYLDTPWSEGFYRSRVNFHADHARHFPRTHRATSVLCHLEPGDALLIPVHWLHVPTGMDWSASVTFWWYAPFRTWRSARAASRSVVGMATMVARKRTQGLFGSRSG